MSEVKDPTKALESTGITRRGFLKTTGAAALGAGAVAMGGLAPMTKAEAADAAATEGETIVRTSCRGNCGSKCPTNVVVRDGKVVRVVAAELPGDDAPRRRFCVKGYTQPQRVYDPDRLKYPMKRTGERGEGQWERISWDEAIDTIVGKMGAAVQEAGGTSIAFWSSYGSYGVLNGQMAGYMSVGYGRMITALGATVLGAGADYAQIYEQSTLLGISGNDTADIANAKTIMAWGGNPAEAYIHDWHYVCDARENGAKLITIDPQFTASAAHSDIYVPIRPATDGALMLGMANYIIDNELMDTDFMKAKTVSPFLIKEDGTYFRMSDMGVEPTEGPVSPTTGKPTVINPNVVWDNATGALVAAASATDPALEGVFDYQGQTLTTVFQKTKDSTKEYTVEKASEICDIPVETIENLARIYATEGPVAVLTFQGLGHHVNSHHNYKNLAYIAALTGNAGKPGAMMTRGSGMYPFNAKAYFMGMGPGVNTTGMYLPKLMEEKKWGQKDVDIRVLWMANGNVLSCESGRQELIEAVKKVDFVVCADVNMTDSAQWADIVLPIPHAYETEDFDPVCPTPYPTYYHKAIDPLYECKTDLEILQLIAEKMGMSKIYGDGASTEELMRAAMDSAANLKFGGGYDAFQDGKVGRNYTHTPASLVDTFKGTASQRLEYYIEKPAPRNNFGQEVHDYERLPYYEHANESYWENPLREKYPLMGCSQHNKYHVHSQCAYTPVLREIEPEPTLKVNASDAAERGISQGDYVRVFNDRGYAVLKAVVTEGIKPGVVSIPHGFQADQFVEGHTQDLTNVVMNDFCSNSSFYDFLCEVEKYEGGER